MLGAAAVAASDELHVYRLLNGFWGVSLTCREVWRPMTHEDEERAVELLRALAPLGPSALVTSEDKTSRRVPLGDVVGGRALALADCVRRRDGRPRDWAQLARDLWGWSGRREVPKLRTH